uniref:Deoxyribodipyrimidine photo-lyase n=1 Tax=Schistocephalus solidus TaxID=70667 RepID=A0A0X3P794_SCHSO
MASNIKAEQQQSFDDWVAGINLRRSEDAAKSVGEFGFATCRVRLLSGSNKFVTFPESAAGAKQLNASEAASLKSGADSASVLYWMNRDQRVQDNWALLFAQRVALKFSVPLHVCFNLPSSSALSTRRHFDFQLAGLKEIATQCKDLNIGFTVLPVMNESSRGTKRTAEGQFVDNEKSESTFRGLLNLIRSLRVAALITDFSPLREDTAAIQTVSQMLPSSTSFFSGGRTQYCTRLVRLGQIGVCSPDNPTKTTREITNSIDRISPRPGSSHSG